MELVKLIEQWHEDRNLIAGSTDKDQFMKLLQEVGELSDSLCKGKDFRDDVGDIMVVASADATSAVSATAETAACPCPVAAAATSFALSARVTLALGVSGWQLPATRLSLVALLRQGETIDRLTHRLGQFRQLANAASGRGRTGRRLRGNFLNHVHGVGNVTG